MRRSGAHQRGRVTVGGCVQGTACTRSVGGRMELKAIRAVSSASRARVLAP